MKRKSKKIISEKTFSEIVGHLYTIMVIVSKNLKNSPEYPE
jgi:hypothetical protein